jgi:Amt family ammonium transporter
VTDKIIPLRVNEEEERLGLDISQHDESLAE